MGNSSKTVKSMSLGNMFAQSGTMNSREATGELSRIEFCLQPGRSTARLFEISLRTTTTPTMPSMPGRCVLMTKRKPDQVIEYRISLQDKQSEQLDSMIAAIMVKNVGEGFGGILTPLVAGLSDVTFVVVIIILYEMVTGKDTGILVGLDMTLAGLRDSWVAYRNSPAYEAEYTSRASSVTGGLVNIFENIIFSLTGGATANWMQQQEQAESEN